MRQMFALWITGVLFGAAATNLAWIFVTHPWAGRRRVESMESNPGDDDGTGMA